MFDFSKMEGASGWATARGDIRKSLLAVLGKMPRERVALEFNTLDEEDGANYTRQRVSYFVDDWTRVSAWLFVPNNAEGAPGILCCHQESEFAKDECAGVKGNARLAFARHYAEMGFVTLAPDCITAGERVSSRLAPYDSKLFYKDNPRMSILGKMYLDHTYALEAFGEVRQADTERLGAAGHGLGATNALLLAALDTRVAACVASCGFTRFATDEEPERWLREEGLCLLPSLLDAVQTGQYPFDWEHILALAAPTPMLILNNIKDTPYSKPKSCGEAVEMARKVYKPLGASRALEYHEYKDGHKMTFDTLDLADDWFERWL